MWILVLMFVTGYGSGITAIPDFESRQSCIETGEQWKEFNSKYNTTYVYKCIHKGK